MAQKAGLGPNIKNHSGRKTMIQTLVDNDVPPTDIMQLSGHRNVQSITSYSTVSQKQQLNMSHTLTGLSSGEIAPQSGSSIPEKRKHEFDELTYPTFRPTFSQQSKQAAQQPLSLFSGAVISGGHISVAINTLNQAPTLSAREENPSKTYNIGPQCVQRSVFLKTRNKNSQNRRISKNGRQISQYKSKHIFTIEQYGHRNSPKELNFSPYLGTTLCAQFPLIMSRAP